MGPLSERGALMAPCDMRWSGLRATVVLAVLLVAASDARTAGPEAVTILRDAYGVPHVFTRGPNALARGLFANGYAQAEDRLFEADIFRRAATGRLAERLGPDYLLMDEVVRRDGYTAAERARIFRRLPARTRHMFEAFRDGANAFIARVTLDPMRLPLEFAGTPPAPWTVDDSVAVAILAFRATGANGGQEVLNAALLLDLLDQFPESEARGIFDDAVWMEDPAAPVTIAAGEAATAVARPDRISAFAPAQLDLVRAYAASIRQAAVELRAEQGLFGALGAQLGVPVPLRRHASNAILVAPRLSASGAPLFLGGPQSGLNAPSFFWEIGLHAGSYEAEGVNAPGTPGVLIGRGRGFAMSLTSGILDNVDTYVERLDPHDADRYLFHGRSLPFTRRSETIHVSGAPDVTLEVLRTIHGPVFFIDRKAGVAFSRRAAFLAQEAASMATVTDIGFVRRLGQFRRLADRVAMSFNLHYADDAGNIAYFHRGTFRRRPPRTDPRLPLDGRGQMEWKGTVPADHMPTAINPARGYITNWNNKPVAGWSAGEQRELWGIVDRVQTFIDALEAARAADRRLTLDDVKSFMRHAATADIFAVRVVPFLEDAVAGLADDPAGVALKSAAHYVRVWVDAGAPLVGVPDRNGVIPYPGAAIYREFRTAAQATLFQPIFGAAFRAMSYPTLHAGDMEDDHGSFGSPDALFLRTLLFAGPVAGVPVPAGMLPASRDYFAPRSRATVLAAALQEAIGTLTGRFATSDQSRWQLPALLETYRDIGAIGTVFGTTIMERENRGSFNLVVELGHPAHGEIIVPPGSAGTFTVGDVGHEPPHLRDQLPLFEAFQYRRQPFAEGEIEGPITSETIPFAP